ncbi:MAG TPA: hypothetical protein VJU60_06875 [Thermoleophilaceae bacterium]|nr:hypothetical protein [Thermoleophilaceae bacterium]
MKRVATVLALAALVVPVLSGCSRHHQIPEPEGENVIVNGLTYTVFITRELNLRDPEDHDYFQGPEAPPGFNYYGVFIEVCNDVNHTHGGASTPVDNFRIVDTAGQQFLPKPLPRTNVFAYRPRPLSAKQCIPTPGSAAAAGPIGGSLLLFKIPVAAIENRPMDLEINPQGPGPVPDTQRIELDI